jgi:hypothetical protein
MVICNSWHNEKSLVIKVEHEFDREDENIPLDKCWITGVYYDKKWIYYSDKINFVTYINALGKKWNCKKCKF